MRDDTGARARNLLAAFVCVLTLAGCSKSEPQSDGTLNTSKLPRIAGAKEIFASPASTIFTTPNPVAQTADTLDKALAADGWQKYVAPHTSVASDANQRIVSLKKGPFALGVFITVAPAQGNATSVQYNAVPLKNDLPFPKDATNIEFDPNKPLLTAISGEPIEKTLDFYRKELAPLGWSLWSQKQNGIQPAGGPSGELTRSGAYAYYLQGDNRLATLVLERLDSGGTKIKFEESPTGYLASLQRQFFNSDNTGAALVDVQKLPRLEGAKDDAARSSADRSVYSVARPLADTSAALKQMLAADGWKPYAAPLEETHTTSLNFKRGTQGLAVSFTIQVGKNERTSEETTVYYSPVRLNFALAAPDDATDVVFDENRPYLNVATAGTVDGTLDFFRKELAARGWAPLSAADATKQWPNAKLEEKITNGTVAYFVRGTQRPIVLTIQRRDDGKTNAEIRVPPFAQAQTLEKGDDIFGLPRPKLTKTAGGTGGQTTHEVHATVPAGVDTVLAFYRGELSSRNWKEETQGAVVNPDNVVLNFTSPEGPAVLKLGHKYDLTTVSLVQQLPKPTARVETPAAQGDSIDALMKQAQQMVREATADAAAMQKSAPAAQPPSAPTAALRVLAENKAPVPVPDTAEDVEFDGADGKLEFSSASSLSAVADFYRATMKGQGWDSRSSVINNANMVVLNFAKGGKSVSFTIMRMGNKTNVSADGSALKVGGGGSAAARSAAAPVKASAEDLEAEESGGLPVPKRRTMSEGTKTPFRRELKASVPLELADVLDFYRRELGKLNWKEDSKGALVTAEKATIAYTSPDGPAILKLGRKDDATSITLLVKDPGAATKAGIMPKAGQAKVLFGNINDAAATITFNGKAINVGAGTGVKNPDGPMLDLAPGKYKYSIRLQGKPAQNDEVDLGADEVWGLMIGPGGVLALQAY